MIQKVATGNRMLHTMNVTPGIRVAVCEAMDPSQPRESSFQMGRNNQRTCHSARDARIYLQFEGTHPTCRFFLCLQSDMDGSLSPL